MGVWQVNRYALNQTLNCIIRFKFHEFHWSFISHFGTIVLMYMYWHRKWVTTSSSRFNFTVLSQKVNIVKKNHRDIFFLAVCSIENSNNMIYLKDFFFLGGGGYLKIIIHVCLANLNHLIWRYNFIGFKNCFK